MTEPFADRFEKVRAVHGPLVAGLDPSRAVLESWGLGDSPDGLDRFVDIALGAAAGNVGIVKPQSAFYERHGWRGMRTLERLAAEARSAGMLVIADAKRGDVGSTNEAYAEVYLGPGAPVEADAVTVHPYLGLGAMSAFAERAAATGSAVLVVVRSSNPEGRALQSALEASGSTVEQALLDEIGRWNTALAAGALGPLGAVIGSTHLESGLDLLAANGLILAPGVGAQGATPAAVARIFASCPERVMPSASRSLLERGPDEGRLAEAIAALASELVTLLAPG